MYFTKKERYFMLEALKEAKLAIKKGEVPIGAIVVSPSEEIIGRGHNMPISLCDPTAHAEILAIREAAKNIGNYRLIGCEIYVTIEPCPMCAGALVYARLKRLVFGARDLKAGACGSVYNIVIDQRLNHQLEVVEGLFAEEAKELIQRFFHVRR